MFQDQTIIDSDDNSGGHEVHYPGYRSESVATLLAVFPGLFIHGLGHFYAGDYLTGSILLGLEFFIVTGAFTNIIYSTDRNEEDHGKFNPQVAALVASAIIFVGSWIYDFAHADAAVRKHNNKIRAQIGFSSDRENDVKVTLGVRF